MAKRYEFIQCAKRLGGVLLGRTDPSVTAVITAAHDFATAAEDRASVNASLRAVYDDTLKEGVPASFQQLLRAVR